MVKLELIYSKHIKAKQAKLGDFEPLPEEAVLECWKELAHFASYVKHLPESNITNIDGSPKNEIDKYLAKLKIIELLAGIERELFEYWPSGFDALMKHED